MLESMRVIDEKQKVERILIYSGDIKKPPIKQYKMENFKLLSLIVYQILCTLLNDGYAKYV